MDHKRNITGMRRRNNIFGEVSDYIVMQFLAKGGDGAIYNPAETSPVTLFARSETELYFIKVLYHVSSSDPVPTLDSETKTLLIALAKDHGAIPAFAIARSYSKHANFYNLNGLRIKTFK